MKKTENRSGRNKKEDEKTEKDVKNRKKMQKTAELLFFWGLCGAFYCSRRFFAALRCIFIARGDISAAFR
jgi:hypothetical protein